MRSACLSPWAFLRAPGALISISASHKPVLRRAPGAPWRTPYEIQTVIAPARPVPSPPFLNVRYVRRSPLLCPVGTALMKREQEWHLCEKVCTQNLITRAGKIKKTCVSGLCLESSGKIQERAHYWRRLTTAVVEGISWNSSGQCQKRCWSKKAHR